MTTTGILLAAGRGRRFDSSGARNKLLETVAGIPVAVASAQAMLAVLPRVIAVVAPLDGGVADALRAAGCEVVICADADTGMAASLVHALRHRRRRSPGCGQPPSAQRSAAAGGSGRSLPSGRLNQGCAE